MHDLKYTGEQLDKRLSEGYYDDIVAAGIKAGLWTGANPPTKEQVDRELFSASIGKESNFVALLKGCIDNETILFDEVTKKIKAQNQGVEAPDLSSYYNKTEVDDKLNLKVNKEPGRGLISDADKLKLDSLQNYNDDELRQELQNKASKDSVYTKKEVDSKILGSSLVVSQDEKEIGILQYAGRNYVVYERTVELLDLPIAQGASTDVIICDSPLGDDLYFSIECFSVSSNGRFIQSHYDLQDVYTNEYGDTIVSILCKKEVTQAPKSLLTIRYIKGLLNFEIFDVSIPLSELNISSISEVSISIPELKYGKKMAFSYSMDDGKSGSYEYFFKHTLDKKLTYTDGCGNNILFNYGNAWTSLNYLGVDLHNSPAQINGMLWANLIKMLDFGGGVFNHGGGVYDNPNSIKTEELAQQSLDDNCEAILNKTGVYPFYLICPGGNTDYMLPWYNIAKRNVDTIYAWTEKNHPKIVDPTTLTLGRLTHDRENWDTDLLEGNLDSLKAKIDTSYTRYDKVIYYCFSHTPGRTDLEADINIAQTTVYPILDYIYNTYGARGADTIWVAPCDEIYEYLFTSQNSKIQTSITGDKLNIKIKLGVLPGFRRKDLSLLIQSTKPDLVKTIDVSSDVVFVSCGKFDDTHALLNIGLSNDRIKLAEKYVGLYEKNINDEALYEANYMIGRLKQSLRQPYLDRINNVMTPVLNGVVINNGQESTNQRQVNVRFDVLAPITHYRIGENSDLSTLPYIPNVSKEIQFTISDGYGTKTLYAQVKNNLGESDIVSKSIFYQEQEQTYYTVTASSNNNAYGLVTPETQQVLQGSSATVDALANDGYLIESWVGADSFTGVNQNTGNAVVNNITSNKNIICNFKKEETAPPVSSTRSIISFGWDYKSGIPSNTSQYDSDLKVTKIRSTTPYVETPFDVYDINGVKSFVISIFNFHVGNETFQGNTTGNDSGVYPDKVLQTISYRKTADGTSECYIKISGLQPGIYKFKLFINTKRAFDLSLSTYELVADTIQNFQMRSSYVDNFNSTDDLIAVVSGDVRLNILTTDLKNNTLIINALEVEKMDD